MDKEKILAALYAIQNGDKDIGQGAYHDELETLITIVVNVSLFSKKAEKGGMILHNK